MVNNSLAEQLAETGLIVFKPAAGRSRWPLHRFAARLRR
jgi:hypothetical protein